MASSKDTFEPRCFLPRTFAPGVFRGTGSAFVTITAFELEWSLPENQMHYKLPANRMDYSLPDNPMHYTVPRRKPQ